MRPLALCLTLILCACPSASPTPDASFFDAGTPDAGRDAGTRDAGVRPDAGQPRDAGFVDVPISAWCNDLAFVQCMRDVRCLLASVDNLAECIAKKSQFCDPQAFTRAANEGRLQYLKPQAADCLNAYGSGSCQLTPPACARVFGGLQAPDAGCILDEECNDQGYCYQYDSTCPHHCLPWVALGKACDGFTTRCRPGDAFCGTADGGAELCLPLKGEGEPCVEFDACRADLACSNSKCVKRAAERGEPCGQFQGFPYCSADDYCRQDTSSTPPAPGTCQPRGGLGAVCTGSGSCLASLRCGSSFITSTCQPRAAEGEPCSAYGECQETLYCPTHTSRCAKVPGSGADCTTAGSDYECASAHFCDFNSPDGLYTCRAKYALGEPCTYDGVCLSNDCEYSTLPDGGFGGSCVGSCAQRADGGF